MAIRIQSRSDIDVHAETARVAAALGEMRSAFAALEMLTPAERVLLARLGDHGPDALPVLARDAGLGAAAASHALTALTGSGLAVAEDTGRQSRPAITNLGRVVLVEIRRRGDAGSSPGLAGDLSIAADAVIRLRDRMSRAA